MLGHVVQSPERVVTQVTLEGPVACVLVKTLVSCLSMWIPAAALTVVASPSYNGEFQTLLKKKSQTGSGGAHL